MIKSRKISLMILAKENECYQCQFLSHTDAVYGGGSGRVCQAFKKAYLEVIEWGTWDHLTGAPKGYRIKRLPECLEAEKVG